MRTIARRRLGALFVGYLVFAHALLGLAIFKTDLMRKLTDKLVEAGFLAASPEPETEVMTMLKGVHRHVDRFVPNGATIFLGDSITMSLATAAVAPLSINYGIGGLRSDQLIETMDQYGSLRRAGAVVIAVGTNDLLQSQEHGIASRYKTILAKVPPNVGVVMSSVPPIKDIRRRGRRLRNSDVKTLVSSAKAACESDRRCVFVDTYRVLTNGDTPLPDVLEDDGVHLAPHGYELWMAELRRAVSTARSESLS